MRSRNRKKYSATKAESFEAYRVIVKDLGCLSIFAGSAKAAEQVARRILGGAGPYNGFLEVKKEKLPSAPKARKPR